MSSVIRFRTAAAPARGVQRAEAAGRATTHDPAAGAERFAGEIAVGQLVPDPEQPRCSCSEERLQALAASIRASGVVQPLLVREHPDPLARLVTPYMLIVGERRWTAARRAGLATVPVMVRIEPLAPLDRLMMQIAENDGELHEELALGELAAAVARAFRLAGCSQRQFARRYGRSRPWLALLLRLAVVEGATGAALREGRLRGLLAARTFLRLGRSQQRRLLAEARQSGVPITLARAEKAADQAGLAKRRRAAAAAAAGRGAGGASTAAASEGAAATTAKATPAAARPARVAPALCGRCRAALGEPGGGWRKSAADSGGPAARGRRMQLLPPPPPPVPVRRTHVDGPWVTLEITGQQLETLVTLLGKQPAETPRAQVEQLLACL